MRFTGFTLCVVSCVFAISCMTEGDDPNVLSDSAAAADDARCDVSGTCTSDHGHVTTWYLDSDGDGYGDHSHSTRSSSRPTGYVSDDTDCDDSDAAVHPGAVEVCNGIDDDCNDLVDDADPGVTGQTFWHFDGDGDDYGIDTDVVESCYNPGGYAGRGGDCNDESARFHPGAVEDDCTDPNDYNCDGTVAYADDDGDGWPACQDCDDRDWHINPDAIEICDGVDNNCDTRIDDADPHRAGGSTFYIDNDGDGYGTFTTIAVACLVPDGFAALPDDCDDSSTQYHPGAWEADCTDPNDYNCDGSVAYEDRDGDSFAACEDCNDGVGAINPAATEMCNGVDDNCDGLVDDPTSADALSWYRDSDDDDFGDATDRIVACDEPYDYVFDSSDCDDADGAAYPGAVEVVGDGIDNNCDGVIDATGRAYAIVAWNTLGMHCYNPSFKDLAVLPPYNSVWAQVIRLGDPSSFVTSGITLEYSFASNTFSADSPPSHDKTDFWTYVGAIFGVSLAPNVGLTGNGLSGEFTLVGDHYEATGIPLTEYDDVSVATMDPSPDMRQPYQLATVVARDSATGESLATSTVVVPVSSELSCQMCHADDGDATTRYPILPTGSIDQNILTLHDYLNAGAYDTPLMDSRPVFCAGCHSSNALGAPGLPGVSSLSNAMHRHHQSLPDITPDTNGCYNCHPGPTTHCLRDTMTMSFGFNCTTCHGTMDVVATNADPWLNEPRCDNAACHGAGFALDQPLYRNSKGHGGLYCAACHDSPHAIAPSREPNDAIKFIELQGMTGTLRACTACHATEPTGAFTHGS